jgi:hypothetical protein
MGTGEDVVTALASVRCPEPDFPNLKIRSARVVQGRALCDTGGHESGLEE